jgi:hypothetical protein
MSGEQISWSQCVQQAVNELLQCVQSDRAAKRIAAARLCQHGMMDKNPVFKHFIRHF